MQDGVESAIRRSKDKYLETGVSQMRSPRITVRVFLSPPVIGASGETPRFFRIQTAGRARLRASAVSFSSDWSTVSESVRSSSAGAIGGS